MMVVSNREGGTEVSEMPGCELPSVVLVMDSEGVVRLHGWPEAGLHVSRGTMEKFLTFLIECDCLTLGGLPDDGPHGDETDEDELT